MRIGELAQASGVSRDTLRFYETRGLIRAQRQANGYRRYAAETALLVNYIRSAQQLGFSLAEIGKELPAVWQQAEPGPAIQQLLAAKLGEIDARIDALKALRDGLAERLGQACPLVAAA
jgi:MerR family copper efflux transcriptional regulator